MKLKTSLLMTFLNCLMTSFCIIEWNEEKSYIVGLGKTSKLWQLNTARLTNLNLFLIKFYQETNVHCQNNDISVTDI